MNKTVLIVANDFTTIYHFRMELLQKLNEIGAYVVLALPQDNRNKAFLPYSKVVPIPLSRFGTNPLADLKTCRRIIKVIKSHRPHIVYTYTAKANIYGGIAAQICGVPYVCNVTGLGKNFQSKNFISKIMLMLQRVAYRKARMVFFQNASNYQLFMDNDIVKGPSEILPGSGVNIVQNSYETFPNNAITKFIVIARVRHDKGYDELFEAIKMSVKEGLPAEFHIVGWYEDETYKRIIEEMVANKFIIFHGNVDHVKIHELIKDCDCLIHPSHHEGMSNVILEAAATGRPCIVSNIHGCIEGVENILTGYHFKVKDCESLFEKIKQFVDLSKEEREEMGRRARILMVKKFDRDLIVKRYVDLFQQR